MPGSGRCPGEGNGYPLQYACLEKSMERSLATYSPWSLKESDMSEQLSQWLYEGPLYYSPLPCLVCLTMLWYCFKNYIKYSTGTKVLIGTEFQRVHVPIEDSELGPRAVKAHLCRQPSAFHSEERNHRNHSQETLWIQLDGIFTKHLQRWCTSRLHQLSFVV